MNGQNNEPGESSPRVLQRDVAPQDALDHFQAGTEILLMARYPPETGVAEMADQVPFFMCPLH